MEMSRKDKWKRSRFTSKGSSPEKRKKQRDRTRETRVRKKGAVGETWATLKDSHLLPGISPLETSETVPSRDVGCW